jgi:urease accessory protein
VQRASHIAAAGTWTGPACDRALLDYEARHRRRTKLQCESGREVMLDLAAALRLRHGDALVLDDGGLVEVHAAREPLLELRTACAANLTRLAWHLGNRHVAVELGDASLRIQPDHVLADLARRLGATVIEVAAPFDPEPGAYAAHAHAAVLRP